MKTRGTLAATALAVIASLAYIVSVFGESWGVVLFRSKAVWPYDDADTRTVARISGRGVCFGDAYLPLHSSQCFGPCERVRTAGDMAIASLLLACVLSLASVLLLQLQATGLGHKVPPPQRLRLSALCGTLSVVLVCASMAYFAVACHQASGQLRQATAWMPPTGSWGPPAGFGGPSSFGPPGGLPHAHDMVSGRPGVDGIICALGVLCSAAAAWLCFSELGTMLRLVDDTRVAFVAPGVFGRDDSVATLPGVDARASVTRGFSGYLRV